jgi:fructokinase
LLTRIGRDADGDAVLALLDERGIDTSLVERDSTLPTGTVTVGLSRADPTFTIHEPAAWDAIAGPGELPPHDVFCFGTLIGRSKTSFETLTRLLPVSAAFRALDVNLRPPADVSHALAVGLHHATLVKANEEELRALATGPKAMFDTAPQLRWLCVTRGPEGALLFRRDGKQWTVAGVTADVVDTVGAGDAFFAGLVDALAHEAGEQVALERAQALAVKVVSQRGGLL